MPEPLFILARDKRFGPLQEMDAETLRWIAETSVTPALEAAVLPAGAALEEGDFQLVREMVPLAEWFYSPAHIGSIHGMRHILRVMFNSAMLCRMMGFDPQVQVLAASLHDVRRVNDFGDPGHGVRAREYYLQNHDGFPEVADKSLVAACIEFHEVAEGEIPDGLSVQHRAGVDLMRAADALDRYRQPVERWWPKLEMIRLQEAHALLGICRKLTLKSEENALTGMEHFDAVWHAAKELLKNGGTV